MKKHLKSALALILAVFMTLALLPAAVFATEIGETATLVTGLPEDGSYGVIYSCGEGYSCVMGYDISNGAAAVCTTTLTGNTMTLPEGAGVFKFVKNTDGSYYLMLGSKYLISVSEALSLSSTLVAGAKWVIETDAGGMEGAYNIKNATDTFSSKPVYLEQFNNAKFCGYTYLSGNPKYFQFKVFSCSEDTDGRIGAVTESNALPTDGSTVVIYNAYGGVCFGQEQGGSVPSLAATVSKPINNTLPYDNIGNGALIFTVHYADGYYTFENNGKYLANPENYTSSTGMTMNAETLMLQDTETAYTKWELSAVNGGYVMYNKTAKYYSSKVCIEFYNGVFSGWSYSASTNGYFAMQFYPVQDKFDCGYVVNPGIVFGDATANFGMNCNVSFTVDDIVGIETVSASYWCDSNAAKSAALTPDETVAMKYALTVPAAELAGRSLLNIRVDMTDTLGANCSETLQLPIADEVVITGVTPAPGAETGSVTRPEISVSFINAGTNPTVHLTVDGISVSPSVGSTSARYTPSENLADGIHVVQTTVTRTDGACTEKSWNFYIGERTVKAYFGQMHSHTAEYSDGAGQLEDAYSYAYAAKNLDYLIVTDHSNYFDTTSTATTSSYYDLSSLSKTSSGTTTLWEEAKQTAAEYNTRYTGEFICAYGYEMTWSGGPGHMNTFNTYGVVSRNNSQLNTKTSFSGMYLYYDEMVKANSGLDIDGNPVAAGVQTKYLDDAPIVSQFNHPGATFGTFGTFVGCTQARDDVINLIEVGNGDGAVGGSSYWPSYEQYDTCLAMGWHIAPTNNQDNHKGKWGDSNTCRNVILTDDFTETGLYNALAARHVYATEDDNLQMIYHLNTGGIDFLQGDIATGNSQQTVTVKCDLLDPDGEGLGRLQIIGENGVVLSSEQLTGSSYAYSKTLPNSNAYYYVKLIQADGQIAVSAPVWVTKSVPVAVSVTTDNPTPVVGATDTIRATVKNDNESGNILVTGYTVKANDTVLAEMNTNVSVEPDLSFSVSVPFTPALAQAYEITATFRFTCAGRLYAYDATITRTAISNGIVPGDVDESGVVNALDVAILRRYLAGGWGVSINAEAADVDESGTVNARDVALIRRYLAGWDVVLR